MKELKRRREWGAGKDPVKLASMPWPVFPRNSLAKVLGTLLDEVIKIDKANLGIYCVPFPKDLFPDFYQLIKQPMDYRELSKTISEFLQFVLRLTVIAFVAQEQ